MDLEPEFVRQPPLTVEGQIEAVGAFAHGLRTNPRGRRRAGVMLAAAAVVVLTAVTLAALVG